MSSFKQIILDDYKIFSRFGEERRKQFKETLRYISVLSDQTSIRVDNWDVLKVFGTGEGNEIVTDVREINKRFFANFKALSESQPIELKCIEAEILMDIDRISAEMQKNRLRDLNSRKSQMIRSANDSYVCFENAMNNASNIEREMKTLQITPDRRFSGQIQKICANPFYVYEGWVKPHLHFTTANDIIVKKKNPAANLDIELNLGKFRIRLNTVNSEIRVLPYQNNWGSYLDGHHHPFLDSSGKICWGNTSDQVLKLIPQLQFAEVFELLAILLTSVPDGVNPYRSIENFYEIFKVRGAKNPENKAPELAPTFGQVIRAGQAVHSSGLPPEVIWSGTIVPGPDAVRINTL